MARSFFLPSALFALRAVAQTSTAFTDEKTGIKFQGIVGDTGYRLGYAIPETPTTDFIAQIQAPITNGGGWAGLSMGQSMTSNVLVVAWPNEGKVLSSFRQVDGYTSPPVVTGNFSMKTIPDGTFVTDKAFSYTFLCSNCLSDDSSLGLVISETLNVMGWAWSDAALTDSTTASAGLNYHDAGFGAFGLKMSDAKSADFDKWAALAVGDAPTGGNSTLPAPAPAPGWNSTAPAIPVTPGSGNTTTPVPETPTASPVVPSALPTSAPVELPEETPSATPSAPVTSAPAASAPATTPAPAESATPSPSTPAPGAPGATAGKWERCGGIGHTGPTACAEGWKCVKQNDYYSQCLSGLRRRRSIKEARALASLRQRNNVL